MLCAATKLLVAQRAINKSICAAAQKSNALDRLSDTTCALAIRTPKRSLSISENAIVSRSVTTAIVYSSPASTATLHIAQHPGVCQECTSGRLVGRGLLPRNALTDNVGRLLHAAKMHAAKLSPEIPRGNKLGPENK